VKYLPLLAAACVASLAACEYRESTVRSTPAVVAAPASTAVVTTPVVPATTTTVYTR
jgi:hypothetical protein